MEERWTPARCPLACKTCRGLSPRSTGYGAWWSRALGCWWGDVQGVLLYLFEGNLSFVIVWLGVSGE